MFRLPVIFGLLLLLLGAMAFGKQAIPTKKPVPQVLRIDHSKPDLRSFDKGALNNYSKDRDFQYDSDAVITLSWWDRFWHMVWQFFGKLWDSLFSGKGTWVILKYLLLAAAIGFLVYIILKIVGIDVTQVLRGESKKVDVPYSESLENIHEISFDEEIERAINDRNFRMAVRLLYLRSLKNLNDARLIHWQINKTNSTYLAELADDNHRQGFGILTRQFEYVWYGDFPIDGTSFQNINLLFQNFNRSLR